MAEIIHCSFSRARKVANNMSNADGLSGLGLKQMPATFILQHKEAQLPGGLALPAPVIQLADDLDAPFEGACP